MEDQNKLAARLGVTAAAVAGDSGGLYHLVARMLDDGIPLDVVLFDVLVPTEQDLGTRWQQGDVLISEEHAATSTIETVVALLAGSFDQPDSGPRIVVAAAEGDSHSLPGRLISAHLLFLGYRVAYLGGNVDAADLAEYLESEAPDALVLSCALPSHLIGARAAIKASHEAGVPVVVGGRGFGPEGEWAPVLGADAWVGSPRDVPETLDTWNPDPAQSEARALDASEDLIELVNRRLSVIASAQSQFEAVNGKHPDRRATAELDHLFNAVIASMLVDDPELLSRELTWHKEMLDAHGSVDAGQLSTALVGALNGVSPSATALMRTALSRTT
jgi:methanogenic corrinoid protein MtbC1